VDLFPQTYHLESVFQLVRRTQVADRDLCPWEFTDQLESCPATNVRRAPPGWLPWLLLWNVTVSTGGGRSGGRSHGSWLPPRCHICSGGG